MKFVFALKVYDGITTVLTSEKEYWESKKAMQDYYEEDVEEFMEEKLESVDAYRMSESTYETEHSIEDIKKMLLAIPEFEYSTSFQTYIDKF